MCFKSLLVYYKIAILSQGKVLNLPFQELTESGVEELQAGSDFQTGWWHH